MPHLLSVLDWVDSHFIFELLSNNLSDEISENLSEISSARLYPRRLKKIGGLADKPVEGHVLQKEVIRWT